RLAEQSSFERALREKEDAEKIAEITSAFEVVECGGQRVEDVIHVEEIADVKPEVEEGPYTSIHEDMKRSLDEVEELGAARAEESAVRREMMGVRESTSDRKHHVEDAAGRAEPRGFIVDDMEISDDVGLSDVGIEDGELMERLTEQGSLARAVHELYDRESAAEMKCLRKVGSDGLDRVEATTRVATKSICEFETSRMPASTFVGQPVFCVEKVNEFPKSPTEEDAQSEKITIEGTIEDIHYKPWNVSCMNCIAVEQSSCESSFKGLREQVSVPLEPHGDKEKSVLKIVRSKDELEYIEHLKRLAEGSSFAREVRGRGDACKAGVMKSAYEVKVDGNDQIDPQKRSAVNEHFIFGSMRIPVRSSWSSALFSVEKVDEFPKWPSGEARVSEKVAICNEGEVLPELLDLSGSIYEDDARNSGSCEGLHEEVKTTLLQHTEKDGVDFGSMVSKEGLGSIECTGRLAEESSFDQALHRSDGADKVMQIKSAYEVTWDARQHVVDAKQLEKVGGLKPEDIDTYVSAGFSKEELECIEYVKGLDELSTSEETMRIGGVARKATATSRACEVLHDNIGKTFNPIKEQKNLPFETMRVPVVSPCDVALFSVEKVDEFPKSPSEEATLSEKVVVERCKEGEGHSKLVDLSGSIFAADGRNSLQDSRGRLHEAVKTTPVPRAEEDEEEFSAVPSKEELEDNKYMKPFAGHCSFEGEFRNNEGVGNGTEIMNEYDVMRGARKHVEDDNQVEEISHPETEPEEREYSRPHEALLLSVHED
uniref:BRCT domain-containing protein n=1 Tax=Ascaris lumbricoides TaxID=6252 RepID=A0A0M3HGV9_ASCLU